MAIHCAVLHSSQSLQGGHAIALPESKGRDAVGAAAPHSGPAGHFRGREVVEVPVVSDHRIACRRDILGLSVLGAIVAGAGLYAGVCALQAGHIDGTQDWEPNLYNLLSGAAGFVVGGALPSLLSRCCRALPCRRAPPHLNPTDLAAQALLEDLVTKAIGASPLTPKGLAACAANIHALHRLRGGELPPQAVAEAIARLAQAVPDRHIDLLIKQLVRLHDDGEISTPAFRQALVSLAAHLPAPGQVDEGRAKDTLAHLLRAYPATAPAGDKSALDTTLWAATDFTVSLCGTPYFASHAQTVRVQAARALGCHVRGYREALPVAGQRSQSPAKAATPISAVTEMVHLAASDQIKRRVGSAIGIAMNPARTPVDQGRYLLAIVHALAQRTDLPPGAFLEGLLTPEAVLALAQAIVKDPSAPAPGVDRAMIIAELPRLCQLQASAKLMAGITQALRDLHQQAPGARDAQMDAARQAQLERSVEAAFTAVDARITGIHQDAAVRAGSNAWSRLLTSPAASLHHPWQAGAGLQALAAIRPPARAPEEPSHAVIEVRDFQNAPKTEKT